MADNVDAPADQAAVVNDPAMDEDIADNPAAAEPPKRRRRRHQIQGVLPPRPRKALTAYSMFLKDYFRQRVQMHAGGPGPLPTAKTAMLDVSAQWKALSEADKARYEQQCMDDKARYRAEMKLWKTQKNFVKRPASAYALFLKDAWAAEKAAGRNPKVSEMGKIASTSWRELSAERKATYNAQHKALKTQKDTRLRELALGNVSINDEGVMQINEQPAAVDGVDAVDVVDDMDDMDGGNSDSD